MHIDTNDVLRSWFALRVKSRSEKLVSTMIRNKGVEEFHPCYESRRRWSDRVKSMELPLFPGYVFCRLDPQKRLPLLTIPGVLHFVGIGRTPIPIDEHEMAAIQAAVRSGLTTESWPYIEVGQKVRLEDGPLAGLEGICVGHSKQQQLVISLTLLRRSIAVNVEREWVRSIDPVASPIRLKAALSTTAELLETTSHA
jgi:transcription antitermination factor NusG